MFSYLSYRAAALIVVMGIAVVSPWPVSILLAAMITAVGWFWIIKPYIRIERMLSLFTEGYSLSPEEAAETISLTPAV